MLVKASLLALSALGLATPYPRDSSHPGLRLVKTSASDPGQWVTEHQKYEYFTSKNIPFIDITDITDKEVLSIHSAEPSSRVVTRATKYPPGALHKDQGDELLAKTSNDGPRSWLKTLTDFHTRHYMTDTGVQAADWLFAQVQNVSSCNPAVVVRNRKHDAFEQSSVVARIPGHKPDLVVVGAHLDSTAGPRETRSPGAVDDGTGTVVLLEALRVLAESGLKPNNTIEFHWYAAEEGGLLFSQDIWAVYKADRKNVVGYLNQDMAGHSPSGVPAVYEDYVDAALSKYITALIKEYLGVTPNKSECGYGCSDHASARANGFPAAFVADDVWLKTSPDIHSEDDTYDKVMWPTVLMHSKLVVSYLFEASYI
ncbi:hypothetical protein EsDP_00003791 [Epichloe bromicola]|uniref:Peptide hydrolase n=1 Tax=Epichloe bromicola TaxID=79588 RepID=A0ABQ0CPT2_9HYPO